MLDLRDYKDIARDAVKQLNARDGNYWRYSVKSVTKKEIRIGWAYLDYIGMKEPFTVTIDDMGVIGDYKSPWDEKAYIFVGNRPWDDTNNFSDGIRMCVKSLARAAENIY